MLARTASARPPPCSRCRTTGAARRARRSFVDAVAPARRRRLVGAENRFGHPAPDVVARYRAAASGSLRTDRCGAVTVVRDDDGGFTVERERPSCDALRTPQRP